MREFIVDKLKVEVLGSRHLMGLAAAMAVAQKINQLLSAKAFVNIIFAAAPSQIEFLEALLKQDVDWTRVNAFHMDEYLGLDVDAPQGFGNFLRAHLFHHATFNSVNYLNGNAADAEDECLRYAGLLNQYPTDIVCMGIGENTHLAFNDPHVANFSDAVLVKIVDLDNACRIQQVNDGCFARIEDVPTHALTLTIPALVNAPYVFVIVPGENKAEAVKFTLNAGISEKYPSTILRRHPNAVLFADDKSGGEV
ncbi:glucosamine-6-phosphate deaminase [Mucilaginibacter sp. FT3.2]|uniref:glucosamine-6-phosphate deaminase n=1 Tax=Mucilaginibacter sp. FT3.2 TaxID=2723090 RepID=UPI0016180070|nr:glucosamine-6-phosphate deaminase [Mucilaginibacter sp. FT3.2]MBB6231568.1 glucosamine-6-phosphate deaminase [Mucilaginibacter sp. FT3.2]